MVTSGCYSWSRSHLRHWKEASQRLSCTVSPRRTIHRISRRNSCTEPPGRCSRESLASKSVSRFSFWLRFQSQWFWSNSYPSKRACSRVLCPYERCVSYVCGQVLVGFVWWWWLLTFTSGFWLRSCWTAHLPRTATSGWRRSLCVRTPPKLCLCWDGPGSSWWWFPRAVFKASLQSACSCIFSWLPCTCPCG